MAKTFLDMEKVRQTSIKGNSLLFSPEARAKGMYKKELRDFCLPEEYSSENIYIKIRNDAIDEFRIRKIQWHDDKNGFPSNHLCDSQVSCVNFLYPFANQPIALASLLRPFFPSLKEMLPIEDNRYVTFEWIGAENYLKEKIRKGAYRTRGANCTSADAVVRFKSNDGTIQIVLIEWKYTESYQSVSLKQSKTGTDRTNIYRHLYDAASCPLNKKIIPSFDDLFFEPFYQFMRQQFLANEMEKAHELHADRVSVLHIAPRHNTDFVFITSPAFRSIDTSATKVWKKLVAKPERFLSVATEDMFGKFDISGFPFLQDWYDYITTRYEWVKN